MRFIGTSVQAPAELSHSADNFAGMVARRAVPCKWFVRWVSSYLGTKRLAGQTPAVSSASCKWSSMVAERHVACNELRRWSL